jgi:hypothetical protein
MNNKIWQPLIYTGIYFGVRVIMDFILYKNVRWLDDAVYAVALETCIYFGIKLKNWLSN